MNPYRTDFPILKARINGKPLIYVDNAATSQKPREVLTAINDYYTKYNANIQRGIHTLSQRATEAVDAARQSLATLIHADPAEIVFTYGTTFATNFIAYAWAERTLRDGDEIVLTTMEHHSNTVPWMELAKRKKIKLKFVPVTAKFELDYGAMERLVGRRTKLISVVHISNVLGTLNDIPRIVKIAKRANARVFLDAAQSISRMPIDIRKLTVDFLACSGHKMYGPTGSGFLYIRKELISTMQPFLSGGGMIIEVTHANGAMFQKPPEGLEAGTIHIEGAIGLGAAARYLMRKGLDAIERSDREVSRYAYRQLSSLPGVSLFCHRDPHGVLSFNVAGMHPHDVGEILNRYGVAIRTGNHCTMPLHRAFKLAASARISLACYNTKQEIDVIVTAIKKAQNIFKK